MNGLLHVSETYTKEELIERIRSGVPTVDRADPTAPEPPLKMPPYRDWIAGQELQDLASYLMGLRPQEGEPGKNPW